tara:strand:+ start:262 stop:543 length:282 start_codon:yes stop_codon:yes gene_type:complete
MGLGRKFFSNVWGKPEWDLPSEEEVMENILKLKKQIEDMPNSPEKTKAVYTLANQMQILRLILHDKKKKLYRPDAKGKWVWIDKEDYDGRKYE